MSRAFDEAFQQAVGCFNRQEFFECHEVLEDLWRPLPPGPEKTFLQGLLQVGVGFHHLQNGNFTGARNKLQEGLEKLKQVVADPGYTAPIPLMPLIGQAEEALQTVLALGPERLGEFPSHLIPEID